MNNMIIYHNNCSDGFTSAAIAYLYFKQNNTNLTTLFAGNYGEPPPIVDKQTDVYLVDYSYNKETILDLLEQANSVTIIDHHITAIKELKDLSHPNFMKYFDTALSGAGLTWEYFFPDKNIPDLIKYVQDRDLWNWVYSESKDFLMGLEQFDFTVEQYIQHLENSINLKNNYTQTLIESGKIISKYFEQMVNQIIDSNLYFINYKNYQKVPILNCNYKFSSNIGNILSTRHNTLFSIMYYIVADSVYLSFRSVDTGVDVSIIAKELGGGGHRNASGAKISLEQFNKLFVIHKD